MKNKPPYAIESVDNALRLADDEIRFVATAECTQVLRVDRTSIRGPQTSHPGDAAITPDLVRVVVRLAAVGAPVGDEHDPGID